MFMDSNIKYISSCESQSKKFESHWPGVWGRVSHEKMVLREQHISEPKGEGVGRRTHQAQGQPCSVYSGELKNRWVSIFFTLGPHPMGRRETAGSCLCVSSRSWAFNLPCFHLGLMSGLPGLWAGFREWSQPVTEGKTWISGSDRPVYVAVACLCYLPALWSWETFITFLCLSFLLCKMGLRWFVSEGPCEDSVWNPNVPGSQSSGFPLCFHIE